MYKLSKRKKWGYEILSLSDDIKFAYKFADTHKIDSVVINNRKEIRLFDMF